MVLWTMLFWTMLLTVLRPLLRNGVFWNAIEAIGTWVGGAISGVAIFIAIRAISETGKAIRVQLMPLVVPSEPIHLKAREGRYPQITLQTQGNGRCSHLDQGVPRVERWSVGDATDEPCPGR